jgi:hypothetical protein
MDTFDIITLGVFLLVLFLVAARMTFWKQKGQVLSLRETVCPVLLCAIAVLSLSVWHHWNAPHRRAHQFLLGISSLVVSTAQFAMLYTGKGKKRG